MPAAPIQLDTLTVHEPLLVNTIGHAAGAVVFGIFLVLLLADRSGARLRGSRLSLAAAALAFVWNLASLIVIAIGSAGITASLLIVISSSALSLLPALLLHISPAGQYRWIVTAGYGLSAVSVAIHSSEFVLPAPHHHRFALILITLGFGVLTIVAAVLVGSSPHGRRRLSRVLGTMSLFLFAMSFVHFDSGAVTQTWAIELVLHHAGIPLALFVLLQDYRFVLVDAFLRFLGNILLAAAVTFAAVQAAALAGLRIDPPPGPFRQGMLLVAACLALILFAVLRSRLQAAFTRTLFRREPVDCVLAGLSAASAVDEAAYLDHAAARLAAFLGAGLIPCHPQLAAGLLRHPPHFPSLAAHLADLREPLAAAGIEVVVPLRLTDGEPRFLCLGRRQGGRRYLSEDLEALARLAAEITAHVDRLRESELRRLVSEAELRALQAQIHPHFLFNALNTLYGIIPREAHGARDTVLNLADIFRYFLHTDRGHIPLEEELNIIRAYLAIESLRLGAKLRTEIDADPAALAALIPVLSVEPLVENAVKHGVAARTGAGLVRVEARVSLGEVLIRVSDTGPGFSGERRGVGLDNVARRLRLSYGPAAALAIESSPAGSTVSFRIPITSGKAVA